MDSKQEAVFRAALRTDFYFFLRKVFATLNPGTTFKDNWHLKVIASELADVANGKTPRLIMNMPPRSLKSIAASVALVAWYLGHNPSAHVICASYGNDLSKKFAFDCRKIMTSAWYEATFVTRVDRKKSSSDDFFTVQGGSRLATSVKGAMTGRGADLIVIDDPAKPDEMLSETQRNEVNDWMKSTVYSRLNDKMTARIVIAMQRLHVDDLSGHLLREGGEPWRLLKLPARAEVDGTYTYWTPQGLRRHVRKAGELLHPARESEASLAQIKAALGSYFFNAQYQQEPMLPEGNIVKMNWFPRYEILPPTFDRVFQSWDTASKGGDRNSFSVCTTWGVVGKKIYLIDVWRKRVDYPELKRAVVEQDRLHGPRVILVEDKSSGIQLIQELKREGMHKIKPIKVDKDKEARLRNQTGLMENGQVVLPKDAPWLQAYETELMLFPVGAHDDQVDSTTQALADFQESLDEPGLLVYYRELNEARARGERV